MSPDDLNDELSSHLEFQVRKHMAAGMSEAEARRRAYIEFGGMIAPKRSAATWIHGGMWIGRGGI